jgi:predicted dehydrogenase
MSPIHPDRSPDGDTVVTVFRSRQSPKVPKPPTLALAGAGVIAVVHGLAAEAANSRIVAIASRSPERAAEFAIKVDARSCSFDDLPAGADAVIVCTPPSHHCEQTLAALSAGALVLVEKPLATTLADADAIVAADVSGHVLYAENQAFAPVIVQALRLISELGPLEYLELRTLSPRPTWGDFLTPGWGGGALFDLGAHPIALALLAAGDDMPIRVTATLSSSDDIEVDDGAEVMLEFRSGLTARVEVSWRNAETVWDLQASSANGVVRAELMPEPALEHNGEPVAVGAAPEGSDPRIHNLGYVEQIHWLARISAGETSPLDADFGRRVLDVICGAYASARNNGSAESLPFAGPRDRSPHELWKN